MKIKSMKKNIAVTILSVMLLIHFSSVFVNANYKNCLLDQNLCITSNNEIWDMIVPDDYHTIQQAIQAAGPQHGYHIFVKNGTYKENLNIRKDGIILKGESKEDTIIIGQNEENTIFLTGNYINISQFTIQHGTNNHAGISFYESSGNTIEHNIIKNDENGIVLVRSHGNIIQHNILMNNHKGCFLDFCLIGNTIKNNIFLENNYGVYVNATCRSNIFYQNTFKDNTHHAFSLTSNDSTDWNTQTLGNYWDDYTGRDDDNDDIGDTPYIILPGHNQDHYPLMTSPNDYLNPIIRITKPKENYLYLVDTQLIPCFCTLIFGKITIEITAWENESGIDYIHFYINDNLTKNTTKTSFSFSWDQPTWGKQVLKIKAFDTMQQCTIKEFVVFKFG